MSKINIFISHKVEDMTTAQLLKDKLDLLGGDRIECFISEKIQYGKDWFDEIKESLLSTNILVLIFTSTTHSWDWPLYEVGLATNLDNLDACKIITLYPPGAKPPEPIKHLQAVEATEDGVETFLNNLICTDEITGVTPINTRLAHSKDLASIAKEISSKFQSVVPWEHCFTNFLWIVTKNGELEEEKIPDDAYIEHESSALSMFGLTNKPPGKDNWLWEDILSRLDKEAASKEWVDDLNERFYYASKGDILKETKSTFTCIDTGKVFRPLLHKVKLRPDGSMCFEVIFVQHYELADS